MPNDEQQLDTLPPALIDALREMDGPAVLPDAQRDADVLSGARRHLAGTRRRQRSLRLFFSSAAAGAVAAAAVVGVVVYVGDGSLDQAPQLAESPGVLHQQPADPADASDAAGSTAYADDAPPRTSEPTNLPGDIDNNGGVNILDAYALARRIQLGQGKPSHDLNADGLTDQRDIDWIANKVVALNPGERG